MPCTSIVSNTKVNVTRISSIYESTDGLESDSLKEVQRESTQSDDSVMDDTGKENLISQKSEEVDMEVGGSVIESGVVTASAVQVPRLEISIPSKQGLKLKNNLHKFEKAILKGPTHKCFSCERLCYEQLGALYSCDVANDLLAVVNESVQESIESVWLCNKCKSAMERKKIPAGSQFNKMKVPEVPSVFIGLNTLEQRLISKATVFMKMVILPRGGQRAVRGQVINFPSNVDCVISELPRLPSGEDILYIQQPDSIGSKPNGSVPDTIYHTCRYSNVMQALKWLKQHNPLYGDITITKMSEDMFNHKEEKVTDGENVNEDILEMDET